MNLRSRLGVTGSNPVPPTTHFESKILFAADSQARRGASVHGDALAGNVALDELLRQIT